MKRLAVTAPAVRMSGARLAIALGCLTSSAGAAAQVHSLNTRVQLDSFQVQLTDTAPLDGIAPSVSFDLGNAPASAALFFQNPYGPSEAVSSGQPIDLTYTVAAQGPWGGFGGVARVLALGAPVLAPGQPAGTVLRVEGHAEVTDTQAAQFNASAGLGAAGWGPVPSTISFTLAPHTEMTVRARWETFAGSANLNGVVQQNLGGSAFLNLQRSDGTQQQFASVDLDHALLSEGRLSVTLRNDADTALTGTYSAGVSTWGYVIGNDSQGISPVPEPTTGALWLAGVAAVGAVVRRRRAR